MKEKKVVITDRKPIMQATNGVTIPVDKKKVVKHRHGRKKYMFREVESICVDTDCDASADNYDPSLLSKQPTSIAVLGDFLKLKA
jgi:hypothetical protein